MASKPNSETTSLLFTVSEERRAVLTGNVEVVTPNTTVVKKKKWTKEENEALEAGVEKHGFGKWSEIKKDPSYADILSERTNVDFKDKFRNVHDSEKLALQRASRKEVKKQKEIERRLAFATAVAEAAVSIEDSDPNLFEIEKVNESLMDRRITVRGVVASTTHVIKEIGSVVLKEGEFTIKCVLNTADNLIRPQDAKDVTNFAEHSYLAFQGVVSLPSTRIKGSMKNISQKVVLQVSQIYGIGKTLPPAPVETDTSARSEAVIEKDMEVGEPSRVSDVPAPANQKRVQAFVSALAEAAVSIEDSDPNLFPVEKVDESMFGRKISVRGEVASTIHVHRRIGSVVLKEGEFSIRCVLNTADDLIGLQDAKDVTNLAEHSYLALEGVVSLPDTRVQGSMKDLSQQVVILVGKIYGIGKTLPPAPVETDTAARSEAFVEKPMEVGVPSRVSDVLELVNQGILRIQSCAELVLREFFSSRKFIGMRTQKLIAGSSSGAPFCKLNWEGYPTCLAHSPQFARQMAIRGGSERVFEIGPVFKEDSISKQLCEYTGVDVEMRIDRHYFEVVEFVESLFVDMFNKLHEKCKEDFQAIQNQHPYEKLKYFQFNAKVRFDVGLQLLENAGTKVIHPLRGLNPEEERKLGKIVLEEYETEFYILYDCPSAGSTFYTKQSPDVRHSSNSFDVFLRGKKILSGGEREIDPDALYSRAADLKISGTDLGDWDSVCTYIEAFQCTMPRHGGFGVDLNQVTTMLFSTNDTDKAGVDGKEAAVKGIEAAGKDGKDTSRKARNKARVKDKGK